MNRIKIFLCGFVLLIMVGITAEETESYKYPISIDFEYMLPSSLAIEFKSQRAIPVLLKDSDDSKDEKLAIFKSYLAAVEKNSFDNVPFSVAPPLKDAEGKLKLIHAIYEKMQTHGELFLVRHIVGNESDTFLWGPQGENGEYMVCGTTFIKNNGKASLFWANNFRISVSIICTMFRNNKTLYPVTPETLYEFSFYVNDGTNDMVRFKFNGKKYNIPIDKPPSDNTDRIVDFYIKSQNALGLPLEEYAEFFTEKSKEKIIQHYKEYPQQKEYLHERNKKFVPIIRFILDANPVYIVFCRSSANATDKIFDRFAYIVDTKEGLKLTNFGYSDAFDQMLEKNIKEIQKAVYPEEFKDEKK